MKKAAVSIFRKAGLPEHIIVENRNKWSRSISQVIKCCSGKQGRDFDTELERETRKGVAAAAYTDSQVRRGACTVGCLVYKLLDARAHAEIPGVLWRVLEQGLCQMTPS